ncbi:hypothetical protein C8Q76DRAFT_708068 [Earliella scabrosa]|nr:hypothetical protein C8Q76DRAFT_708068 [Earliella scabrosa]
MFAANARWLCAVRVCASAGVTHDALHSDVLVQHQLYFCCTGRIHIYGAPLESAVNRRPRCLRPALGRSKPNSHSASPFAWCTGRSVNILEVEERRTMWYEQREPHQ